MPRVVVIDAKGNLAEKSAVDLNVHNLCKAGGHVPNARFAKRATWLATADQEKVSISLYARDAGRAGNENKYELPPPLDTPLYYGKMVVTGTHDDAPLDMSIALWTAVREKLFGGFEDLGSSSDASSEEDIPAELATKEGYMRDGFVVDDESDNSDEGEDSASSDTESDGGSVLSEDEFVSESESDATPPN
jgi:hypothetical protein